jgi:hypothetical protein
MKKNAQSKEAIEKEISYLEGKLKVMGAVMGTQPNVPRELHLAFLRRVHAIETQEETSRGKTP